jgi:xanthine dehydrogenase YagS FAD-binding subunit
VRRRAVVIPPPRRRTAAATVLVALGATVELTNAAGVTRRLLLEDFFVPPSRDLQRENDLRPQEILIAIKLPKLPPNVRMAHVKQSEKESFDWPLADVARADATPGPAPPKQR